MKTDFEQISDMKLIDELLCDIRDALRSRQQSPVSWEAVECFSNATALAMRRLRANGEMDITASLAKYFDKTKVADSQ